MRSPRTLFWINNARRGAENLGELDDPRQTCVAINAGEFMSDARAEELGIMQYLYGGQKDAARQAKSADPEKMAEESSKASDQVRQTMREHEPMRAMSIEERAYVENAVVAGHRVTPSERATAGQMGAEWTGPTPDEITKAGGSYQEAAGQAAQAQGLSEGPKPGEELKPAQEAKAEAEKPPEESSQRRSARSG